VGEPIVQLGPACWIDDVFDTQANFGKDHDADVKEIERLGIDEGHDLGIRLWPPQLGKDRPRLSTLSYGFCSRGGPRCRVNAAAYLVNAA
jgi:hypothetical protein